MTPVDERVTAGAAFLDVNDPGWWREDAEPVIDLDRLNLRDGDDCVLGQRCPRARTLCNRYSAQFERLTGKNASAEHGWAIRHGFILPREKSRDEWADLTLAWHVLISERRKLAAEGEPS